MTTIAIAGAGRLATQLATAIATHSTGTATIIQVWSRSKSHATELAGRLARYSHVDAAWGTPESITTEADAYIIAVADDGIAAMAQALHRGREHALIAHTSGTTPLAAITATGHERAAVLYPLQTFSREHTTDFARLHIFIEAAREADHELLATLAATLTPRTNIHTSTSAQRRQLHIAAVFASNFVCHCCTIADSLLADAGLDFSVLQPLVEEQVAKLRTMPPAEAQTGPAARGDSHVMGTHMAMLATQPRLQQLYRMLSESIQATGRERATRH